MGLFDSLSAAYKQTEEKSEYSARTAVRPKKKLYPPRWIKVEHARTEPIRYGTAFKPAHQRKHGRSNSQVP